MNYKYVSIHQVIDKFYSYSAHDKEVSLWDMVEWTADVLEMVGITQEFVPKVIELEVEGYKAELPCDFHKLDMISYLGIPLDHNTSSMPTGDTTTTTLIVNGEEVSTDNYPLYIEKNQTNKESYYINDSY